MATRDKLLQKARNSQAGWNAEELGRLYKSWGFLEDPGAKHTKYYHPDHPDLVATVTRSSGDISKSYVTDAIELIEELIARG